MKKTLCLFALLLGLAACTPAVVTPTSTKGIASPAAETATATATEAPTATNYTLNTGEPVTLELLKQMESEDPTVAKQIARLAQQWGPWYGSSDPSIRPMTTEEAQRDLVFYKWTDESGANHYKVAWNLPGYEGFVLVPPAANWENLNPPIDAPEGHDIGVGQGPVKISMECTEGSDLASMGVPVGAQLVAEDGTGDWVMKYKGNVLARVDNKTGVWEVVLGGSDTAFLYDNSNKIPMPEGLRSLLTSSSPEIWQKSTSLIFTDGTSVPWGKYIITEDPSSNKHFVIGIPVLVDGVYEMKNSFNIAGGSIFYPIFEIPAVGGSNFLLPQLEDNLYATNPSIGINYINEGKVPLEWFASSLKNPLNVYDYVNGLKFTGIYNGKQISDVLKKYIGQVIIVNFVAGDLPDKTACLEEVIQNQLINLNGQSQVNVINSINSLTLP